MNLISNQGNVLVIYDSSDDLDVIKDVLPQWSMKVHVIVTTRCRDHPLMNEGHVIWLQPLDEDAAVEAFLSWAGKGNDTSRISQSEQKVARDIVNDAQVKGLPLAVRRVATYMKVTRMTCNRLINKLLEKQTLRYSPEGMEEILKSQGLQHLLDVLRESDILQPHQLLVTDVSSLQQSGQITRKEEKKLKELQKKLEWDITTTMNWDLDLEEVSTRSEEAIEILNFCSLMDGNAIPIDVLLAASSGGKEAGGNEASVNEEEFRRRSSILSEGFSLISCDCESTCSIHALVQQSVVKRMERLGSLSFYCDRLARCLSDMMPQSFDEITRNLNNRKIMALLPHIYSLSSHILYAQCIEGNNIWNFLWVSCECALQTHDISTAKQLAESKIKILRKPSMPPNPIVMTESKRTYFLLGISI